MDARERAIAIQGQSGTRGGGVGHPFTMDSRSHIINKQTQRNDDITTDGWGHQFSKSNVGALPDRGSTTLSKAWRKSSNPGLDWFERRFVRPSGTGQGRYISDDEEYFYPIQMVGPQSWSYQRGGSVNPHEETTRAAREWSPGEQRNRPNIGYDRAGPTQFERILQDNTVRPTPDLNWADELNMLRGLKQGPGVIDHTIRNIAPPGEGMINPRNPELPPWHNNNIGEGSFWNVRADQPWDNSGVMLAMNNNPAVKRAKGIYNQVDPYTPDIDWNEKTLGYDFNLPLWGGNLGFEFDYDIDYENYGAGINWNTGWGA